MKWIDISENDELEIDDEFSRLCPPLFPAELALLEQSIVDEGLREMLTTWGNVIVDGHNRYAICRRNKIDFQANVFEFESREEAKQWILKNQLSRRNLGRIQASVLRGQLYRQMRCRNGGARTRRKNGEEYDTSIELAKMLGVGPSTIRNDVHIADAVDKLSERAKLYVMSPDSRARKQNVIDLSCLSHKDQDDLIDVIKDGKITNLRSAITRLRPVAVSGQHSVRCKRCGAKLAPGVVTCLACDIESGTVKKLLASPVSKKDLELDLDDEAAERLNALRERIQNFDEVNWHIRELRTYLEKNQIELNTKEHKELWALAQMIFEKMPGRSQASVYRRNQLSKVSDALP